MTLLIDGTAVAASLPYSTCANTTAATVTDNSNMTFVGSGGTVAWEGAINGSKIVDLMPTLLMVRSWTQPGDPLYTYGMPRWLDFVHQNPQLNPQINGSQGFFGIVNAADGIGTINVHLGNDTMSLPDHSMSAELITDGDASGLIAPVTVSTASSPSVTLYSAMWQDSPSLYGKRVGVVAHGIQGNTTYPPRVTIVGADPSVTVPSPTPTPTASPSTGALPSPSASPSTGAVASASASPSTGAPASPSPSPSANTAASMPLSYLGWLAVSFGMLRSMY